MHIDITRKDGKLIFGQMDCNCANDHAAPYMDIYISPGLIGKCSDCITKSDLGKNVLIVADSITYGVAAKTIEQNLKQAGFNCHMCILPGEKIEPTPDMVDYVLSKLDDGMDFLLSVGSGVVTDVTRQSAYKANKPYAVFGTAASMDGYTSVTSAMMVEGIKVSLFGGQAKLLMFDPAVLASAPLPMQAAGVGDLLAKYNVIVDWKLGSAVSGETFCPLCEKLLEDALCTCADHIEEIAQRTEKGMEALIEALILAGLTGLIIGNTRSVSSVEHNMSHYWEMMQMAYGGQAPSHGIGVGIGLIYTLMMHDTLRSAAPSKINKQKIKASRLSRTEKEKFLTSCYPPEIGRAIMDTNADWYLNWTEHEKRIDAIIAYHEQYKKDCNILPGYRDIAGYLKRFGVPTSATKAGIDIERLKKTLACTKDFRSRYSVANALDMLGMLDETIDNILAAEESL